MTTRAAAGMGQFYFCDDSRPVCSLPLLSLAATKQPKRKRPQRLVIPSDDEESEFEEVGSSSSSEDSEQSDADDSSPAVTVGSSSSRRQAASPATTESPIAPRRKRSRRQEPQSAAAVVDAPVLDNTIAALMTRMQMEYDHAAGRVPTQPTGTGKPLSILFVRCLFIYLVQECLRWWPASCPT